MLLGSGGLYVAMFSQKNMGVWTEIKLSTKTSKDCPS